MESFAGWKRTKPEELDKWEKHFEEVFGDDGCLILRSKEKFISPEDDDIPEFEYHYGIRVVDLVSWGSDDPSIVIELLMIPDFKYLCEEKKEQVRHCYGYDKETEPWFDDMIQEDFCIQMEEDYVTYDPEQIEDKWYDYYYDVLDCPGVKEKLNAAASVFESIDRMRGFNLDRAWNRIGTTGWDKLRDLLLGEDMIRVSIDRAINKTASI